MSDPKWAKFAITGPVEIVTEISNSILTVTNTVAQILYIQKTILEILNTLAVDVLNTEAMALKAVLAAMEQALAALSANEPKLHMLGVPLRKQSIYTEENAFMTLPRLDPDFTLLSSLSEKDRVTFQNTLRNISTLDCGNEGFVRTIAESLNDEGDLNRPQYGENDAIFAMVVLAGASNFLGLYSLLQCLQGIFGVALRDNPLLPDGAVRGPQDLRVRTITVPDFDKIAINLSWQNPPMTQDLMRYDVGQIYGNSLVQLREVAIMRCTDWYDVYHAKTWKDLWGTVQPPPLAEGVIDDETQITNPYQERAKIIYRFRYDGVRDFYLDKDPSLEVGKDYYYVVAYRYAISVENPGGTESWELQDYHHISNVAHVRYDPQIMPRQKSIAPDWVTWPNVLSTFPALNFQVQLIKQYLANWQSQIDGAVAGMTEYINYLTAEIQRYADFAATINAKVAQLANLIQVPAAGIYVTEIHLERGGVNGFLQELIKRIGDETDSSTPPFRASGLTAGVVYIAGAPSPRQLAPIQTIMNLIFGGGAVAQATAYEEALKQIERIVDDSPTPKSTAEAPRTEYATFTAGLSPVDPSSEDKFVPFDP